MVDIRLSIMRKTGIITIAVFLLGSVSAAANTGNWVIEGRVSDSFGRGLSGLNVSAYDKDLVYDDCLGSAVTDRTGKFIIRYTAGSFRDGPGRRERAPDIYIKVFNSKGTVIYKGQVMYDSGVREFFDIKIKTVMELMLTK
jgi:hypothetical protein